MVRKVFKPEQIINKLREAEVLLSQGLTVGEVARKLSVTEQTYYRWRKEYGGMRVEQDRRLQGLEKENSRLKKLVGSRVRYAELSRCHSSCQIKDRLSLYSYSFGTAQIITIGLLADLFLY